METGVWTSEQPTENGCYIAAWPADKRATGITAIKVKDGNYTSLTWFGSELQHHMGPIWTPLVQMNKVIFNPADTRWLKLPEDQ